MAWVLSLLLPTRCAVCDRVGEVVCGPCRLALVPAPPGPVGALVAYEGAGRDLVTGLKYRNRRAVVDLLGRALAARAPPDTDVVTWAPTTQAHRRERGFDQAELLAHAVGRALGRPCTPLLVRAPGPPQTGRSRAERIDGPRFAARSGVRGCVVVVDDVVTTGSTLQAATAALRASGARVVVPLAVAATPAPGRRHRSAG